MGSFYDDMEASAEETASLAFDIFNRYGRLRKEFKDHPVKRGSGIWQDELDGGDLLVFETMSVHRWSQSRVMDQKLATAVLKKAQQKSPRYFAVVSPGFLNSDTDKETFYMSEEERESYALGREFFEVPFWRSLGFRRIGSSRWFAKASDKSHPCHSLSAEDDYDPPGFWSGPMRKPCPDVDVLFENLFDTRDEHWHEKIMKIFEHLPAEDPRWQATDRHENTILHAAAINYSHQSIEQILSQHSDLLNNRNKLGETPTEAFEFHLESQRTGATTDSVDIGLHVSDDFRGFSRESILFLIKLKGLVNITELERLRLHYGCTCGQCLSGFLSPWMRHTLQCKAEERHEAMESGVRFNPRNFMIDEFARFYADSSERQWIKANEAVQQGFVNMWSHFTQCLKDDHLTIENNVLAVLEDTNILAPASKYFLRKGGTIFGVGSMLFSHARTTDRYAGDGGHYRAFEHDILKLPECRNDHEFWFVGSMCGYYVR